MTAKCKEWECFHNWGRWSETRGQFPFGSVHLDIFEHNNQTVMQSKTTEPRSPGRGGLHSIPFDEAFHFSSCTLTRMSFCCCCCHCCYDAVPQCKAWGIDIRCEAVCALAHFKRMLIQHKTKQGKYSNWLGTNHLFGTNPNGPGVKTPQNIQNSGEGSHLRRPTH